jgi:hypothetical protein
MFFQSFIFRGDWSKAVEHLNVDFKKTELRSLTQLEFTSGILNKPARLEEIW